MPNADLDAILLSKPAHHQVIFNSIGDHAEELRGHLRMVLAPKTWKADRRGT